MNKHLRASLLEMTAEKQLSVSSHLNSTHERHTTASRVHEICLSVPAKGAPDSVDLQLSMPYKIRIHPHLDSIQQRCEEWVLNLGLIRDEDVAAFRAAQFPLLLASWLPDATEEQCQVATDCITTTFIFDDLFDRDPILRENSAARQCIALAFRDGLVEGRTSHDFPDLPLLFFTAFQQCHQRIRALNADADFSHVDFWILPYTAALDREAELLANRRTPTLAAYDEVRMHTSGVGATLELNWLLSQIEVPPAIRGTPTFDEFMKSVTRLVVYQNDILSNARERDHPCRLAAVLMEHEEGITSEAGALRAIATMHNDEMENFANLSSQLRSQDANAPYITTAEDLLSGSLHWHRTTERYKQPA